MGNVTRRDEPSNGDQRTWARNLTGPDGRLFADPAPSPDETSFQVDNTSDAYYNSPYYIQHENDIEAVPMGPPAAPLALETILGPDFLAPIIKRKTISFHAVGDTGASTNSAITSEAGISDAMVADLEMSAAEAPAFFFHLGDVVYNFGEAEYYYDQFYEPFRGYDRPIVAIPGNHDGAVTYTHGAETPDVPSLQAFIANFCAAAPGKPQASGGLARSTMTQPGVYFTLDAPLVSIIGLYTNVLEGPGVITDQNGTYPTLTGDRQYAWLVGELRRLAPQRQALERAVVLACHHPPASADTVHGARPDSRRILTARSPKAACGPMRSSPDTLTSISVSHAASTVTRFPTSSPAAAVTPERSSRARRRERRRPPGVNSRSSPVRPWSSGI
jgi:hypothetical protein